MIILYTFLGAILAYMAWAYISNHPSWFRKRVNDFAVALFIRARRMMPLIPRWTLRDVSKVVSCKLGDPDSEKGKNGLIFCEYHGDGAAIRELVRREYVRGTDNQKEHHYIYFQFREDVVAEFRKNPIFIIVEYLDHDEGRDGSMKDEGKRGFSLAYDAIGGDEMRFIFKEAGKVKQSGSGSWQLGAFSIRDGNFQKRANGADFRLACLYPNKERDYDIFIRRVVAVALNE